MSIMTQEQRDLYGRLRAFDIDGDAPALTFAARLARENGWTPAYAARVVDEYKRFLLLAATSTDPVTPSDQVDQAWHLHLSYTDSYWNRLCAEVLCRDLHHNPTRGGDAESDKFDAWYERTKVLYERTFGQTPPADIWPPSEVRFGEDLHFARVNTARHRVLPRPGPVGIVISALLLTSLAVLITAAFLSAVTPVRSANTLLTWSIGAVLAFLLLRVIYAAIRRGPSRHSGEVSAEGGCGGGWSFFGGGCGSSGCGSSGCGGGGCGGGGCGGCGG